MRWSSGVGRDPGCIVIRNEQHDHHLAWLVVQGLLYVSQTFWCSRDEHPQVGQGWRTPNTGITGRPPSRFGSTADCKKNAGRLISGNTTGDGGEANAGAGDGVSPSCGTMLNVSSCACDTSSGDATSDGSLWGRVLLSSTPRAASGPRSILLLLPLCPVRLQRCLCRILATLFKLTFTSNLSQIAAVASAR